MGSTMSWIAAAAARARRPPELLPLSVPSTVYATDQDRAVRASNIPLKTMPPESELRNRLPQTVSTKSTVENKDNSTDSTPALTPTSSEDTLETKGS
jgi:hypothetical protein